MEERRLVCAAGSKYKRPWTQHLVGFIGCMQTLKKNVVTIGGVLMNNRLLQTNWSEEGAWVDGWMDGIALQLRF